MVDSTSRPRLAPPGAGIPAFERFVGGSVFKLRRLLGTAATFSAQFERERRVIGGLCAGRDGRVLGTRVLIPRLRGLEDSSRYWSVWMTLEHLRIVNNSIYGVIGELTSGRAPGGVVSTAAVKPGEHVGGEVVAAYEASCAGLAALIASKANLRTALRHAHPWFGPLDAAGWHAMSAMHMGIHRAQIERILRAEPRGDE
jgi:hypothetical protein